MKIEKLPVMENTPENVEVRVLGGIVAGFFPTSFLQNDS